MKPKYLVPQCYARAISSPEEVERLLAQGWLLAAPKPRTRMAKRMRNLRAERRAAGWTSMTLWFPQDELELIKAELQDGEEYSALVMRLVRKQSLLL